MADPLDLSIDVFQPLGDLFSAYVEVFTNFNFGRYILVSTFVSVTTVIVTLAAGDPRRLCRGAAALPRPGLDGASRSCWFTCSRRSWLVIPLYSVFSPDGAARQPVRPADRLSATTLPVALYMLQGYFRGLPHELEEAGLIDGASRIGVILRITLPAVAAGAGLGGALRLHESPGTSSCSRSCSSTTRRSSRCRAASSRSTPRRCRANYLMAGSVIVTVPVMAIFLYFERFLVTGLTAGSVKG